MNVSKHVEQFKARYSKPIEVQKKAVVKDDEDEPRQVPSLPLSKNRSKIIAAPVEDDVSYESDDDTRYNPVLPKPRNSRLGSDVRAMFSRNFRL